MESELHVLVSVKNIFAILQQLLCPAAELDADNGQEDDESIPINMLQKDIAAAIITIVFDLVQKVILYLYTGGVRMSLAYALL